MRLAKHTACGQQTARRLFIEFVSPQNELSKKCPPVMRLRPFFLNCRVNGSDIYLVCLFFIEW
jgi:hypothetical protein